MSFVGTRPEAVKYVEKYKPEYMATLLLPAGITSEANQLSCLILRQNQERAILKMRTDSHGAACIMYRILCAIRWWRDRNSSISRHSALAIF